MILRIVLEATAFSGFFRSRHHPRPRCMGLAGRDRASSMLQETTMACATVGFLYYS